MTTWLISFLPFNNFKAALMVDSGSLSNVTIRSGSKSIFDDSSGDVITVPTIGGIGSLKDRTLT
jgi:hypothetical protein